MKNIIKLLILGCMACIVFACDNYNDVFDMNSPQAVIETDTIEAHRGETVTLSAKLSDESGLRSCLFEYAKWKVAKEILLKDEGSPQTYQFSVDVTIPADAETEWLEDYQKHDGTIIKGMTQRYHKLSLTFYDAIKNKNVVYFYIKVLP